MTPDAAAPAARPARRHDIDWLRVIAVALLFPFHTARIYDTFEPVYVKSEVLSPFLSQGVVALLSQWHMPLLFLLAGASTYYALGRRSSSAYLGERLKRLLLPFLFGLVVLVPPQAYLAVRGATGYSGTYAEFLARYARVTFEDLSGYRGTFTPAHLWFILFLFVLSCLALPAFRFLRSGAGLRLLGAVGTWTARPGRIYLLALLPAVAEALPDVGGKNPFLYLAYMLLGYALVAEPRLEDTIARSRRASAAMAMAGMALVLGLGPLLGRAPGLSAAGVAVHLFRHLNTWCWLLALLAYGRMYLTGAGRLLAYASEAAYPSYLLHQTVIVALAYYLVPWQGPAWVEFLAICLASFVGTLALYEAFVRPWNAARKLMGMKPRPRRAPAPQPAPEGA